MSQKFVNFFFSKNEILGIFSVHVFVVSFYCFGLGVLKSNENKTSYLITVELIKTALMFFPILAFWIIGTIKVEEPKHKKPEPPFSLAVFGAFLLIGYLSYLGGIAFCRGVLEFKDTLIQIVVLMFIIYTALIVGILTRGIKVKSSDIHDKNKYS